MLFDTVHTNLSQQVQPFSHKISHTYAGVQLVALMTHPSHKFSRALCPYISQ